MTRALLRGRGVSSVGLGVRGCPWGLSLGVSAPQELTSSLFLARGEVAGPKTRRSFPGTGPGVPGTGLGVPGTGPGDPGTGRQTFRSTPSIGWPTAGMGCIPACHAEAVNP